MKTKGVIIAWIATAWAVSSCATAPTPEAKDAKEPAAGEQREPVTGHADAYGVSGYEVEVDDCAERTCSTNSECCGGYSCGYDPERSHVQRYCLRG